jgi:hypothetical protein
MKRLAYTDNTENELELELAENLQRARALLARIGRSDRTSEPSSAAETHLRETGHLLSFGCCSGSLLSDAVAGRPIEPPDSRPKNRKAA